MLHGSITALVTPFKNGKVDEKALKGLIEFQIKNGTNAIVPCGTTGESATLSYEEHERTVSSDNCVSFEGKTLQIPTDEYRCNYIRVKVRVHRYTDGSMAVFHGPRKLADYDFKGQLKERRKRAA